MVPIWYPSDGTFGQLITPWSDWGASGFTEARLIMLAESSDPSRGFCTNVGQVNLLDELTTVSVTLYRGDGRRLGATSVTLRPFEYRQVDRIISLVTSEDVPDAFAVLQATPSWGAALAYASVIDNRSGGPVFIPAERMR